MKNTPAANNFIRAIESESRYHNMALNRKKCNYIAMNKKNVIKFSDGTNMQSVEEATYL
mgnify:CR=1 FL=1